MPAIVRASVLSAAVASLLWVGGGGTPGDPLHGGPTGAPESLVPFAASAAAPAPLAFPPGQHAVGFTVLNIRDAARRLGDGSLRPLQVGLWYPAARLASPRMRYRDYVLVAARERTLAPLTSAEEAAVIDRYRGFLFSNGLAPSGVDEWLVSPMSAVREAPREGGAFPLVLIAGGTGGAVHDEAALGEFLASRGYVVATTPSPVRLGSRMESDADVLPRAREQADDLSLARDLVSARPDADRSRAGVVGYSFGARAGLLLAARRPEVRALVSLEGGIASAQAKGWLAGTRFSPRALRIPLLHVYGEGDPASPPDLGLIESLTRSPRLMVKVSGLRHLDFITFGLASATLPLGPAGGEHRAPALRTVHEYVAAFLDARVAGRPEGAQYIAAAAAQHPPGIVEVKALPAR